MPEIPSHLNLEGRRIAQLKYSHLILHCHMIVPMQGPGARPRVHAGTHIARA